MKTRNSDRQKQREDLSVTCQEVFTTKFSQISLPIYILFIHYKIECIYERVPISQCSINTNQKKRTNPQETQTGIDHSNMKTMINLKKHKSQRQFICYDDKDLNIPQEYQSILQKHVNISLQQMKKSDDDRESDEEQIKYAINYLYNDLLQCLEKEKK
ncbi:unnamed protein product (macronuclear) [Paramecium tetraurelia]|uniref:Uncharacterized protein n=1 Tax=Paramecium tetraurelia TaxID=5888 RepID=A0DHR5_PARTE|nr:uncharacterized protein GSPATT00016969001 [Paramecium tetraurelia]CAK82582.1 unnamed protein product [Paramecium tetraurelia]|eukprot:XP_001449979.1 hypothetical protein (macronuclear) [Paramecium tetraurelia strain d4-2]